MRLPTMRTVVTRPEESPEGSEPAQSSHFSLIRQISEYLLLLLPAGYCYRLNLFWLRETKTLQSAQTRKRSDLDLARGPKIGCLCLSGNLCLCYLLVLA